MIRYSYKDIKFTTAPDPEKKYEAEFLIGLYQSMLRIR